MSAARRAAHIFLIYSMSIHAAPELPVKAVICTIYGTLLESGAAPAAAEAGWTKLWREKLQRPPRTTLAEFNRAADLALQTEANILSVRGVENPAPYWPAVAELLLPELRDLSGESAADFLYTHAQLRRSVRLIAGAGDILRALEARGVLLGLISNGHPHTPVELALALHAPYAPVESFLPVAAAHGVFGGDKRGPGIGNLHAATVLLVLLSRLRQTQPARLPARRHPPSRPTHRCGRSTDGRVR